MLRDTERVRDGQHSRVGARDGCPRAVRLELEVFDTGQLVLVNELIKDGLIKHPTLIQLCLGNSLWRAERSKYADGVGTPAASRCGLLGFLNWTGAASLRGVDAISWCERSGGTGG